MATKYIPCLQLLIVIGLLVTKVSLRVCHERGEKVLLEQGSKVFGTQMHRAKNNLQNADIVQFLPFNPIFHLLHKCPMGNSILKQNCESTFKEKKSKEKKRFKSTKHKKSAY